MTITPSFRAYSHAHGATPEQMQQQEASSVRGTYRFLVWRREQCIEFRRLHAQENPDWFDAASTVETPVLSTAGVAPFDDFVSARWPAVRGAR